MIRFIPHFPCLLAVLLLLGSCAEKAVEAEAAQSPIVVKVGDAEVGLDAWNLYLSNNYPELDGEADDELLSFIFDKFQRDLLIEKISITLGFGISDDDVANFINTQLTGKKVFAMSPEDQKLWHDEVRRRLAIQQFLSREIIDEAQVSDEDIALYYEENQAEFKQDALYSIRFMQTSSKEQADAFLKELKKSKKLFREIAGNYAENEGYDLAVPMALEDLLSPFQEKVTRMNPGQYSKVIPVNHGETTYYYVLYLESVTEASQVPSEEAYFQIRKKLERSASDELLQQKILRFEKIIPSVIFPEALPFKYIEAAKRKEV